MRKIILLTYCFIGILLDTSHAQIITIQPYLQDASAHDIYILWETDTELESIVEWGVTNELGNQTQGIAYASGGSTMVHEVHLDGLAPFTQYYYRIKTGDAVSSIFNFKTPPLASTNEPFRIVAMSDMQRDQSFPNKFNEVIEEGVLAYMEDQFGHDIAHDLALVMIPGDLVVNGNNFSSWKNEFFNPAEKLFSHVPVYPVLGNHEYNSQYYFTYFKLPDNGTPGFEEHWWHKDYGNVRIIGLDSNAPFTTAEQLTWLDQVLEAACEADSIDFIFAQLHHPHKSELWVSGESDYTGDVIERLEQFSTNCGKPSIHFFGHTHGYSRGQSRDHKHLWINAASAGGAIDNWGEFLNFDYDEFSVSLDEYGFVMVEITSDEAPKLVVKRIGRGNQDTTINNQITDSLVIRLQPSEVIAPIAISPSDQEEIAPECVTLVASSFASPNTEATHGQSHWQVTTYEDGFEHPVAESWKNFENWYFDIDTQAGDDLTDEKIVGLAEHTIYLWRVRYRDKEMNWSEWSTPVEFSTGASIAPSNLLANPGAEEEGGNWVVKEGVFELLNSEDCSGINAYSDNKYFCVGGLCEHSEVGIVIQNIDMTPYLDSIEAGGYSLHFGGYLSNYSGSDQPEMKVIFLDENLLEIQQTEVLSTLNSTWTYLSHTAIIPPQTKVVQLELKGTRNAGTDNDSYFDDLFVYAGDTHLDCSNSSTSTSFVPHNIKRLSISPNPTKEFAKIKIPTQLSQDFVFAVSTIDGQKFTIPYTTTTDEITVDGSGLQQGMYVVWLRGKKGKTYVGKLMVQK